MLKSLVNKLTSQVSRINPWGATSDKNNQANEESETPALSTVAILKSYVSIVLSKENIPHLTISTALTGLSTGMNFISPWLFMKTLESFKNDNTDNDEQIVSQQLLIGLMVGAYALSQIIPLLRDQVMTKITANGTAMILKKNMRYLMQKDLDYHVKTPSSEQTYLLQKGFSVSQIGTPLLTKIAPTLVETTVASIMLTNMYGVEMGAGLLMLLTVFTGYSALTAKSLIKTKEEQLKTGNKVWKTLTETLSQYKVMRDFGKFDFTMQRVEDALDEIKKIDIKNTNLPQKINQGNIGITRICMLLALLYMGNKATDNTFSADDFVLLVGYFNQLCALLPDFGGAINTIFVTWPDLKFVFSELAKENALAEQAGDVNFIDKDSMAEIAINNISFTYPRRVKQDVAKPVFNHLSFKVKPGQRVALVSESGAGKTTLFNLLFGYYKPQIGSIKINGVDITKVNQMALQRNISLFSQHPNLFNASVRENICYGAVHSESVTDEAIYALAKESKLDGFLQNLSDGLNTQVGEGGKRLSGGQQQKVAILRGLMKQAPIMLLDEVTASLDSQSAREITKAIDHLAKGKTTLMITHKLSEVQTLDSIIVLEKGKAIAQGTHDELLTHCELYQRLWHNYLNTEKTPCQESTLKMVELLGGVTEESGCTHRKEKELNDSAGCACPNASATYEEVEDSENTDISSYTF